MSIEALVAKLRLAGALPIVVIGAGGELGLYISPFVMGALVDQFDAPAWQISLIMALQFSGVAIASITIAFFSERLNFRHALLVCTSLMILGNLVSALSGNLQLITAARGVTGLGEGGVLACAYALGARSVDPDRTFSVMVLVGTIFAVLFLVGVPHIVSQMGASGTFGLMVLFSAFLVPFALRIRHEPAAKHEDQAELSMGDFAMLKGGGLFLFIGFALITMATESVWLFMERIGQGLGLSLTQISTYVLVGLLAAAASPLLMFVMGKRFGRTIPIVITLVIAAIAGLIQTHTDHPLIYVVTIFIIALAVLFIVPFMRATMSEFDASGRLAAASGAAFYLGNAAGPALVGFALLWTGDDGFRTVGWFAVLCLSLALLVIVPAARKIDSGEEQSTVVGSTVGSQ